MFLWLIFTCFTQVSQPLIWRISNFDFRLVFPRVLSSLWLISTVWPVTVDYLTQPVYAAIDLPDVPSPSHWMYARHWCTTSYQAKTCKLPYQDPFSCFPTLAKGLVTTTWKLVAHGNRLWWRERLTAFPSMKTCTCAAPFKIQQ